ncbi:MAG: PmoA family protein [Candidatus Hydrogenedentota bacterium]
MRTNVARIATPLLALGFALASVTAAGQEAQSVGASMEDDQIVVTVDGEEFTAYKFGEEHKYPFFYPVNGPATGESVTAWDQEPYPHHSSLYVSLDSVRSEGVERGNYWQPRHELGTGQVFSRNPEIVEDTGDVVVLRDECDWIVPDEDAHQLRDTRTVTIWAPSPDARILDFEFQFEVLTDLEVGPTGHSFFSARMRPELAVGDPDRGPDQAPLGTGTIVDSEGNRDEEGTRGRSGAAWNAYYGEHQGETEGLAIIQHSDNPGYPAPWFNRNYGFMSPTPFDFIDDPVSLEEGEILNFRYRTVVFTGDHEEAGIAGWREDFEQQ